MDQFKQLHFVARVAIALVIIGTEVITKGDDLLSDFLLSTQSETLKLEYCLSVSTSQELI